MKYCMAGLQSCLACKQETKVALLWPEDIDGI
jgi:hypothetical protein